MKKTPRETRENLIMDWHEKKLNRDELLRVLEWCEEIDKPTKDKMEHEIIKNFYENFEAAKHNTEYELANNLNLEIKKNKKLLQKKWEELKNKKRETENNLNESEEWLLDISELAMDLSDGSWWKKWKLRKANAQREELEKKRNKIRKEIWALEVEKMKIEALLKSKEKKYWSKINRNKKGQTVEKYNWVRVEELEAEKVYRRYKEKYMQMVKDREEYVLSLISQISGMDLWIDEEIKNGMLEKLKWNMMKEIEKMKQWNDQVKEVDKTAKWLEENMEKMIDTLYDLEQQIKEKKEEISIREKQEKRANTEQIVQLKEEEFNLRDELLDLESSYNSIKADLIEHFEKYEGSSIDWEEELLKAKRRKVRRKR